MANRSRCSNLSIRLRMWSSMALVSVTLCVERINFMRASCARLKIKSSETIKGQDLNESKWSLQEPVVSQVLPCSSSSFVLVLEFVPELKRSSTRTRDEGRGRTRLVHDSDARPILEVEALHEPNPLTPSLSPTGGEGARRAGEGDSAWFLVPMRGRRTVEALQEPVVSQVLPCSSSFFVLVLEFVPALKRSSTRTRNEGRGRTRLVHG